MGNPRQVKVAQPGYRIEGNDKARSMDREKRKVRLLEEARKKCPGVAQAHTS
ncbi:hypothetical protein HAX54_008542, partial [Datura stramonium]|nr:hypothetical protein [Datura stramonium]